MWYYFLFVIQLAVFTVTPHFKGKPLCLERFYAEKSTRKKPHLFMSQYPYGIRLPQQNTSSSTLIKRGAKSMLSNVETLMKMKTSHILFLYFFPSLHITTWHNRDCFLYTVKNKESQQRCTWYSSNVVT